MKQRKIYRRILTGALLLTIIGIFTYYFYYLENSLPENIHIMVNTEEEFDFALPFSGEADLTQVGAINLNKKLVNGEKIHMDFSEPFTIQADQTGDMKIVLRLFGILPVKEVSVKVLDETMVVPCGETIGIYVETDGLLVLGTGEVTGKDGLTAQPALHVLKSGDYIKEVNGKNVSKTRELADAVEECGGEDLVLTIRRGGEDSQVKVSPVEDAAGTFKVGIWVRDSTQGIGTLTYVDVRDGYGALGHGITDVDTGLLMEIEKGYIYKANVLTITKGVPGTPGELIGVINKSESARMGDIVTNTSHGISGSLYQDAVSGVWGESVPIGLRQEVELGKAWIRSYVSGEPEEYEIEIEQIENGKTESGRGMVIRITDERLLALTGGIVQGMSGSPILQNGKLIGAVTHVFIKDSTRGYGTFIENMLGN